MGIKHSPPLVLVADDELTAATMLKHIFEREGYQVQIAQDGANALRIAEEVIPDLILLDIQMPAMNGFEVLRQLRSQDLTAGIPTIVVSARAREPSDIAKGLNIGADDYIPKPFAPQELVARAKSKMRARQLEETLQQRTKELEALLRVSSELNQHLEVKELFSLILQLTQDMIQCDFSMICEFDEMGYIDTSHTETHLPNGKEIEAKIQQYIAQNPIQKSLIWDEEHSSEFGIAYGMVLHLEHGGNILGILAVASEQIFSQSAGLLFQGISRQAALALHNAELYEIQANYAIHLEEIVEQRTKELKTAQEMLFRSEKLASIGHLASSIAHEINNPLQPIRLNLEYILEDIEANQPIDRELIVMTQSSVDRISRIVRQLLEFTKSSGESVFVPVDLNSTIRSVVSLNERSLERDKIKVSLDLSADTMIDANRDQLEQVFMNLLLNAKAAMEHGGEISIHTWNEGDKIKIQVRDSGSGISDELINRIFDPFVSTKPQGTGLGLFVTYGIIERHKGAIEVQSKVNQGTIFTITLPKNHK